MKPFLPDRHTLRYQEVSFDLIKDDVAHKAVIASMLDATHKYIIFYLCLKLLFHHCIGIHIKEWLFSLQITPTMIPETCILGRTYAHRLVM
jgi:hypothetical protein